MFRDKKLVIGSGFIIILLCIAAYQRLYTPMDENTRVLLESHAGAEELARAYRLKRSKIWLTVTGRITRILKEDNAGRRHQRFVLKVPAALSVVVEHNIDRSDYLPIRRGDVVSVRGRYTWAKRGGVLSMTHQSAENRGEGGWIQHAGKIYE